MSTTTPNMGLTKPDPDASIGTWDTELNASLDVADAHDHTTGNGVKVPTAGLNINADLSFAGFGATALKVVDLAAVLASEVTGYPTALFVDSADNELYWRTSGGSNVKLTSGTSLNAALLGGFTGDYGSGGSEANFSSGTSIYNFLRAANHRAFIDCSDIRLFQGSSGITNAVKLRSPNSLAASYEFVLPAALPAASEALAISSTGQVIAGVRRTQKVRKIPASASQIVGAVTFDATLAFAIMTNSSHALWVPLELMEGERLVTVVGRVKETVNGDSLFMALWRLDHSGTATTRTQIGASQTSVDNGGVLQSLTLSGLTETADNSQRTYVLEFNVIAVATQVEVHGVLITTDFP